MRKVSVFLFVVFQLSVLSNSTTGQLKEVGKRIAKRDLVSMDKIDHSAYDSLLRKYVNDDGEVNYSRWQENSSDHDTLLKYLEHLSTADSNRPAKKEAKLAYWINAYNAVTIAGILDVYPTDSIRNHTKTFGYNIWKDLKLQVGDQKINLNDIEHEVLRKMDEPRIHFAIVCASVGCPRLLNQAYAANDLERQLVHNTKDFFARSRNLRVESGNQLQISAILKWFGKDFGNNQASQIRRIAPYFPEKARNVVGNGDFTVAFQEYDWNLNSQK